MIQIIYKCLMCGEKFVSEEKEKVSDLDADKAEAIMDSELEYGYEIHECEDANQFGIGKFVGIKEV